MELAARIGHEEIHPPAFARAEDEAGRTEG